MRVSMFHLQAKVLNHLARCLVGFTHLPLLIVYGLIGGLLLATADFVGRILIAPKDILSRLRGT